MNIDNGWIEDLAGDYEAAQEIFDIATVELKGTSNQFEALFAQILADIRFQRLCASEDERSRTVTVGVN